MDWGLAEAHKSKESSFSVKDKAGPEILAKKFTIDDPNQDQVQHWVSVKASSGRDGLTKAIKKAHGTGKYKFWKEGDTLYGQLWKPRSYKKLSGDIDKAMKKD